jgi:sulfur transfer protein SufE
VTVFFFSVAITPSYGYGLRDIYYTSFQSARIVGGMLLLTLTNMNKKISKTITQISLVFVALEQ